MYTPPKLLVNLSAPGSAGLPSYFDLAVLAGSDLPGIYPLGNYDAWCVDREASIGTGGPYTAYLYSSYELGILAATLPNVGDQRVPACAFRVRRIPVSRARQQR